MPHRKPTCRAALAIPLVLLGATACDGGVSEVCGLSTDLPEVDPGFGAAARSDGQPFNTQASWAPGANASVTIGTLDMIVAKDESGSDFDTLVEDGALPFCVPLGERSPASGNAVLASPSGVTNAEQTGGVAILALEGDVLVGRFVVDLALTRGGTLSFIDGIFRARRR